MDNTFINKLMGASAHGIKPIRGIRYIKHQAILQWQDHRMSLLVFSVLIVVSMVWLGSMMGTLSPTQVSLGSGDDSILVAPLFLGIPFLLLGTLHSFLRERQSPQSTSTLMLPINPMERFKTALLFSLFIAPFMLFALSFISYLLAVLISWLISLVNGSNHNAHGLFTAVWSAMAPVYILFLKFQGVCFFAAVFFKERRWVVKAALLFLGLNIFLAIFLSIIVHNEFLRGVIIYLIPEWEIMQEGNSVSVVRNIKPPTSDSSLRSWILYLMPLPVWWSLSYWRLLKTQI